MNSPQLRKLNAAAAVQRQLENCWQGALPPDLAGLSRVVGVQEGTLAVSVRRAAIAAKMKQMEARLIAHLNEKGLQVSAIRYRVQVEPLPHEDKNPKRNLTLSPAALAAFDEAAQALPPSPLRDALAQLVAKRRG